jgi:hypothetical protein
MSERESFDPAVAHAVLGVGTTATRHPVAVGCSALTAWTGPAVGAIPVAPALIDDGSVDSLVLVAHVWERPARQPDDADALTLEVLGAWHRNHPDGTKAVRVFRSRPLRAPGSAWDGAQLAYLCAEPGTLVAFTQRHPEPIPTAPSYVLVRYVASEAAAVPVTSAQASAILNVLHTKDVALQAQVDASREVVSGAPRIAGDPLVDRLIAQVRTPRLTMTPRVRPAAEPPVSPIGRGPELMK